MLQHHTKNVIRKTQVTQYKNFWAIDYDGRQEAKLLVCEDSLGVTSAMYLSDYCATSTALTTVSTMHLRIWTFNVSLFAAWIVICIIW